MLRLVLLFTAVLAVFAKIEHPVTKLQIGIKVSILVLAFQSTFGSGSFLDRSPTLNHYEQQKAASCDAKAVTGDRLHIHYRVRTKRQNLSKRVESLPKRCSSYTSTVHHGPLSCRASSWTAQSLMRAIRGAHPSASPLARERWAIRHSRSSIFMSGHRGAIGHTSARTNISCSCECHRNLSPPDPLSARLGASSLSPELSFVLTGD